MLKLIVKSNPVAPLRQVFKAPKNKHYKRLRITELPELLRKVQAYGGRTQTALAVRMLAYTFVRTVELRQAKWSDFDLDLAIWRIPGPLMKQIAGHPSLDHVVPLSKQVISILKELKTINGDCELLFPNERKRTEPMSENTVLYAIYRLGYHSRMTGHGFRGIAYTALRELGYPEKVIDLQLAHVERNKVRAAYDESEFLSTRVLMMQHWADRLDEITFIKEAA